MCHRNIALLGLAPYGEAHGRRHIISCATEHKAVLEPLEHLAAKGFEVELLYSVPKDREGSWVNCASIPRGD